MKILTLRFFTVCLVLSLLGTSVDVVALAPPSDLGELLRALEHAGHGAEGSGNSKAKIIPLLANEPNPDGPFSQKAYFPPMHEVLVDFRPKQAGGIGDQLIYTPLLIALMDRFPHAKFTVLAGRSNLFDLVRTNPALKDRVQFMDGSTQAQEFFEKVKALKKGAMVVSISDVDYPLEFSILGTGIHYVFIETKTRRGDLGFISTYGADGKEFSGPLPDSIVRHVTNRHEKIEAMLLDLGFDANKTMWLCT